MEGFAGNEKMEQKQKAAEIFEANRSKSFQARKGLLDDPRSKS